MQKKIAKTDSEPHPLLDVFRGCLITQIHMHGILSVWSRILVLCNVQSSAKKRLLTTHQTRRYPKKIRKKVCKEVQKFDAFIAFTRRTQRADHRSPGREQGEGPASRMADWPSHGAVSKDKLKGKIAKNTS